MFGCVHLKSFRFMGVNICLDSLRVKCSPDHHHVVIEGSYTKASATYTPGLASALACTFAESIRLYKSRVSELSDPPTKGLESQVVNSVALSSDWEVHSSWTFRRPRHINILEFSVLEKLALDLIKLGKPCRVVSFADSFVVSAAASKGRTSSHGLAPVLRRYNALCVAGGLYINVPFVPTRLNCSDDPTRDVPLRLGSGSIDMKTGIKRIYTKLLLFQNFADGVRIGSA